MRYFSSSKDELISDIHPWTSSHGRAKIGRPARTYLQQLCADTGCNLEDMEGAMNDKEGQGNPCKEYDMMMMMMMIHQMTMSIYGKYILFEESV